MTILVLARRGKCQTLLTRLKHPAIFCAVALLVAMPWMVRNCYVLGSLKPLGTQGMMELSAAYSDEAFANQGIWFNLASSGFYDDIVVTEDMTLLEVELAKAELSSATAKRWVWAHPLKAMCLPPMKIYNEFRPRGIGETIVFVLAMLGLAQLIRYRDGRVFLGLFAANALAIAATWSVSGRFLVPQLFLCHVLAGAGAWGLLRFVDQRLQRGKSKSVPKGFE